MKRFVSLLSAYFLLALVGVVTLAETSRAGQWVNEPLQFQLSSQGPNGATTIWVRDTTFARLNGTVASNGGALDTTSNFAAHGVAVIGQTYQAAATGVGDSLVVGFLLFQGDSTASVGAISSLGVLIEGRMGGYGNPATLGEWVAIDSVSVGVADGTDIVAIPFGPIGDTGRSILAYPTLRARTTAGVGVLSSARAMWRYWKP